MAIEREFWLPQDSPFLNLPREIRDIVYGHCVPQYLITLNVTRTSNRSEKSKLEEWSFDEEIVIEGKGYRSLALRPHTTVNRSILLVCRQCYYEARSVSPNRSTPASLLSCVNLSGSGQHSSYNSEHMSALCDLANIADLAHCLAKVARKVTHLTLMGGGAVASAIHHDTEIGHRHWPKIVMKSPLIHQYLPNLQAVTWLSDTILNDCNQDPTAIISPALLLYNWETTLFTPSIFWSETEDLIKYVGCIITKSFPCQQAKHMTSGRRSKPSKILKRYSQRLSPKQNSQPTHRRHLVSLAITCTTRPCKIDTVVVRHLTKHSPDYQSIVTSHSILADEDCVDGPCHCKLNDDITQYLQTLAWKWFENADPSLRYMWINAPRVTRCRNLWPESTEFTEPGNIARVFK